MKIHILAIGGRGDVEPLLILGEKLVESGYTVRIITHPDFTQLAESYSLEYSTISSGIRELFQGEYGSGTYSTRTNYFRSWFNFYKMFGEILFISAKDSWELCGDAGLIIYSPPCLYFAPQIAEKLGIPSIPVFFQPFHPTRDFPHYISPVRRNISPLFNLLTHKVADIVMWFPYLRIINRFRKECLNLPPYSYFEDYISRWRRESSPFIYAFSRFVVPRPHDWHSNAKITGYFFRDNTDYEPGEDLAEFISSGEKPLFVGFSSTVVHEPETISSILIETFKRLDRKVVLATGWGGLQEIEFPDNFFKIPSVPHSWLFPKMSLLIHHGGAGTTGAALRSGVPSVVIPFAADQHFWGKKVEKAGCGPAPLQARDLSPEKLYNTVSHVLNNDSFYQKAREMSSRIKTENGTENAVRLIEDLIKSL